MSELGKISEILPLLNERDSAIYELLKDGNTFKEIQLALSASPNQIAFINKYLIKKQFDSTATDKPETINTDAEPESQEPDINSDAVPESIAPIIKKDAAPESIDPVIKKDAAPESIGPIIKKDAAPESVDPVIKLDANKTTFTPAFPAFGTLRRIRLRLINKL